MTGETCEICESFSEEQVAQLSRRAYQERKARRQRSRSRSTHSSSEESQPEMKSRKRKKFHEDYFEAMEARLASAYDRKLSTQMAEMKDFFCQDLCSCCSASAGE